MIVNPKNPEKLVKFLKSKPLILYGMGDMGKHISKWCDEHGVDYLFSDKRAIELQEKHEKNIITPQSIIDEHANANIVVASIVYNKEITEDLLQMGIEKMRIFPCALFIPDEVSWEELENNDNDLLDWEHMHKRYEMISGWGWIPKDIKTVADYGAGKKYIKEYLPKTVNYYPIDYVDRGDNTVICDFNKGQFPNIFADLSTCTGVLVYIELADELISHICEHTAHTVIFSTITIEGFPDIDARRYLGICNDFTEQQIVHKFFTHKFELKDKKYEISGNTTMTFFLFKKN